MYWQGSSEIQADGLQTLYLMNPNYVGYSDTHPPPQPNLLAASATHALSSSLMTHAPPQQFDGIPLSHDPSRPSHQDHIQAVHSDTIPRFHYNVWGLVDQSTNGNQTNMPQQTPRGLSLSLSAAHHLNSGDQDFPVQSSVGMISPRICSSPSLTTTESNGVNTVVIGSKYLKAAQELLDEVAHVGKEMNSDRPETARNKAKMVKDSAAMNVSSGEGGEGGGKNGGAELTTAQRQEIQMKKAKLISMIDEVEQRCRQYHQEMQIVVSSFEQAAGIGSARSYTHLALKTIMKQFKCLKSTISSQIKALNKSLGEEEIPDKKLEGSRLKFIDNQIRQQRALQELRMMQNNAWRPQRGLPERAVSVLRAWLFEHFLHPKKLTATSSDARKRCARYPKDSDKQMLAKQTGLTRSQVSNWFINARVRLWKPMVEEMYLEETKNQEQDNNSTLQENPTHQLHSNSINAQQESINPPTKIPASTGGFAQLISSLNLEKNPKKPRNDTDSPSSILSAEMDVKVGDSSKGFSNYLSSMADATRYGIGDQQLATGFHGNNNFSLSLALPPTETSQGLHQQNFLSGFEFETRIEPGNVESSSRINQAVDSHSSIGYEILDFQNRKPFPAQLLPDFVA